MSKVQDQKNIRMREGKRWRHASSQRVIVMLGPGLVKFEGDEADGR